MHEFAAEAEKVTAEQTWDTERVVLQADDIEHATETERELTRPHHPRQQVDLAVQRMIRHSPRMHRQRAEHSLLNVAQRSTRIPRRPDALPEQLQCQLEALSGYDLSGVRVHHNSSRPAEINAHAYAQGLDIYLASGQERHLPHEAWHVVQQAQGRVRPTLQSESGIPINDDENLEREADLIGTKASAIAVKSPSVVKGEELPESSLSSAQRCRDKELGRYLFVSVSNDGKIGSVYFEKGRIRTIHERGPRIESHSIIRRFVIDEFLARLKHAEEGKSHGFHGWMRKELAHNRNSDWATEINNPQDVPEPRPDPFNHEVLFEIFDVDGGRHHISRGAAAKFELTDAQVMLLRKAVEHAKHPHIDAYEANIEFYLYIDERDHSLSQLLPAPPLPSDHQ